MDNVISLSPDVFVLRIRSMWARPCGGHGVCVNDS